MVYVSEPCRTAIECIEGLSPLPGADDWGLAGERLRSRPKRTVMCTGPRFSAYASCFLTLCVSVGRKALSGKARFLWLFIHLHELIAIRKNARRLLFRSFCFGDGVLRTVLRSAPSARLFSMLLLAAPPRS